MKKLYIAPDTEIILLQGFCTMILPDSYHAPGGQNYAPFHKKRTPVF